jgi:hypothetical protein
MPTLDKKVYKATNEHPNMSHIWIKEHQETSKSNSKHVTTVLAIQTTSNKHENHFEAYKQEFQVKTHSARSHINEKWGLEKTLTSSQPEPTSLSWNNNDTKRRITYENLSSNTIQISKMGIEEEDYYNTHHAQHSPFFLHHYIHSNHETFESLRQLRQHWRKREWTINTMQHY